MFRRGVPTNAEQEYHKVVVRVPDDVYDRSRIDSLAVYMFIDQVVYGWVKDNTDEDCVDCFFETYFRSDNKGLIVGAAVHLWFTDVSAAAICRLKF
jgi:hypothetical protein